MAPLSKMGVLFVSFAFFRVKCLCFIKKLVVIETNNYTLIIRVNKKCQNILIIYF